MRKRREIHTVDDLIELLGSPDATAGAFGLTTPAVHNWRKRGVPLRHHRVVSRLMADLNATAADDLFAGGSSGSDSGTKGKRASSGRAKPKNLLVRSLDDETATRLKRRAARHGRSVEAEHREILRQALSTEVSPDFDSLAAELRALTAGRRQTPAERILREGRDER